MREERRVEPSAFYASGKLYATVMCPLFHEKMIALIIFWRDPFSCHRIAARHQHDRSSCPKRFLLRKLLDCVPRCYIPSFRGDCWKRNNAEASVTSDFQHRAVLLDQQMKGRQSHWAKSTQRSIELWPVRRHGRARLDWDAFLTGNTCSSIKTR